MKKPRQEFSVKSRGQENFIHLPRFAAKLYESLTTTKAIDKQHKEIARDLVSRIDHGRFLDIGTGPGKLLLEIHRLNPGLELFGLDISSAMIQLARKNLATLNVEIECGNIRKTNYKADFFDLVTCTGSFYMWDNPEECLEEIFRILKEGQSAFLFETNKDYNPSQVQEAISENLKSEGLFRRLVIPIFLMKQLQMTYSITEIVAILNRTSFRENFSLQPISLGGLPAWQRIQLTKKS